MNVDICSGFLNSIVRRSGVGCGVSFIVSAPVEALLVAAPYSNDGYVRSCAVGLRIL